MGPADPIRTSWWVHTWLFLAVVVLIVDATFSLPAPFAIFQALALVGTVFAAVHHAELVAHRVGEPFGTLVLALAVTSIEVALIVSMMMTGGTDTATLARDTVFAAVMIVCNGIVGLCLLAGGIRHHEQEFQLRGAKAALSVLVALTALTLIFPNVTTSVPGQRQLLFAAFASLILYGSFLFVQTVRHRDYFLPADGSGEEAHLPPPTNRTTAVSAGLLLVSLILVVALAKTLTPLVERGIAALSAPASAVGIVIAGLVLLPEGLAAYRAANANRLQTSMNLALGSALATIGLTIPVVASVSIILHKPLVLGLGTPEESLLALTLVISLLTIGPGRTTVLQGIVHLVLFAVFLFLAMMP
jgi:Ca2+:H+ antiporter